MDRKKIIITGGGSGGHISTAYSLISSLQNKNLIDNTNFMYVGGDLGMETEKPGNSLEKKLFSKEQFKQEYIRAGKMQRSISFRSIYLLLRTILGFIDSFRIIRKFKPDIVISTGGFVTVPVCLVAKLYKSKIYLHEQTAAIGLANKIVSKFAEKIFITFPSSSQYFPKGKTIHTGNLVRNEIFEKAGTGKIVAPLKKMIIKQEEYPIIYISGGSLGSSIINQTVRESLNSLLQDFQVILQTGRGENSKHYERIVGERNKLTENLKEKLLVVKYIEKDEIGFLLNNINMYVGRSGANTIYELGILQIPSILIPIPWVTNNEQEKNAKILTNLGLGYILPQGELTPEQLVLRIKQFYRKEKNINTNEIERIFIKGADQKIIDNLNL